MQCRTQNLQPSQRMKFTKTETEYNMKSIRFLLLTITTMFIIIAGLMIVLGISIYADYHNFSFFYESAKEGRFFTPSIMSIFIGLMLLVISFLGFFGSLKQSTCLVNLYALILAVILLVKLVVVILAFTTSSKTVTKYINVLVEGYTYDPEIRDEIDQLQVRLNCCGSNSYLDYIDMYFPANYPTVTVNKEVNGEPLTITVPDTCCFTAGHYVCTKLKTIGCKDALVNLVVQNASVLGVLGVSVMFIQLLGIIFAMLLARCIRKLKSEKTLMNWNIKEQMIFAREANRNQGIYINQPESSVA